MEDLKVKQVVGWGVAVILLLAILVTSIGFVRNIYNRYQRVQNAEVERQQSLLNAENELASQQYLKQVATAQAEAKNESAKYEAEAEITRAEGVAKANQIIGDSLKNNEAYLRYLYVNNLAESHNQIIYVPTEAGLPVLEAGKR